MDIKRLFLFSFLIPNFILAMDGIDEKTMADIEAVLLSSSSIVQEAKKSSNIKPSISERELFKHIGQTKLEDCKSSSCNIPLETDSGLVVFTSENVSEISWLESSYILERAGGRFILRGLPDNSFLKWVYLLKDYKEKGIIAPIDLDPDLFKKYDIQSVPSIVLDDGKTFDKIVGNIPVKYALELFSKSGSTSELASKLLFKLNQLQASEVIRES